MKYPLSYRRQHLRYGIGYLVAACLTFAVYLFALDPSLSTTSLAVIALLGAILQLIIQSRYFLHLDDHDAPRWRLMSYMFTWLTLLIVVIGSLWIMMNLNYNMKMSPEDMTNYMQTQNKKGF